MTKSKYYNEEDKPLLVLTLDPEKSRTSHYQQSCGTAVTRGAVNHLGRWPAHVFAVFITGCLIFASLVIIFGIITAMIIVPLDGKCRMPRNIEEKNLPNIYFVKHENRTWSQQEFCYIEMTAKMYKNLTIYLINLIDDTAVPQNLSKISINFSEIKYGYGGKISSEIFNGENDESIATTRMKSSEKLNREKLSEFNGNIKNIDVPIRRFFNGSRLAKICDQLNQEVLEIAAKAYVLWNFPGVALDPEIYPDFEYLGEYLRDKFEDEKCLAKNSPAAIDIDGKIQASFVPCQAFLDHLIRKISMNDFDDPKYAVIKIITDFCPRSASQCRGVKLLTDHVKQNAEILKETFNCPTIFPAIEKTEDNFKDIKQNEIIEYNNFDKKKSIILN